MIDLNTVGRNQLQIHCAHKTRPRIPMITQIDVGIVYKQSHYGWIQNIAFNYTVPGELKRAHCCNIKGDVMILQPVDTSSNAPADLLVCRRFQVGGSK